MWENDFCNSGNTRTISVRDANSGSIVEQLTGEEPVYNLDPVLTYDYMNCCNRIPQIKATEKYLILYAYAGRISNDEADWIAEYAKKKNLKVYAMRKRICTKLRKVM